MKLGVFNPVFYDRSFEEALDEIQRLGLEAVEIACGNYTGNKHCNPQQLLGDSSELSAFKKKIADRGLIISALSCHGNPLHPSPDISEAHRKVQRETIELAAKLDVDRIVTFSGCPGDSDASKYPNWVTSAWPEDYPKVIQWQWKEKVIPYWRREVEFAEKNGIYKIALELHPGFVVYNPETFLKLREHCGKVIGVNFDPSHMFWQGIDPLAAIRELGESIYHFHAKDTFLDSRNILVNGVLDAKSYSEMKDRSWYFRTVGYGHDQIVWKNMMSMLRLAGYDHVISIEHEDLLLSRDEGLRKAVEFLKPILLREKPTEAWWT